MKISAAIELAAKALRESGVPEPRREASSLLAFTLQKERSFLIAHPEHELTEQETETFEQYVNRRANREPFQYIVQRQEFFRLEFDVSPDVLIPRPETEILVETAIEILSGRENAAICEVGVGSGCISVSILHELPFVTAVGLDISDAALRIALSNAEKHSVSDRLILQRSDVFDSLSAGEFDLIVSNPPYVPDNDLATLQIEVRSYEPAVALSGGVDGLSIIKRIVRESPDFLKPGGYLLMEIGFDQASKVRELFDADIWEPAEFLPDLQSIPRIIKARRKTSLSCQNLER